MTSPSSNGFDVIPTMAAVERMASRMEKAADNVADAIQANAECEVAYESAFEKELLRVYHDARRSGERMPAEDIRRALAHESVDDGLYAAHLMAKANLAATDKLMKGLAAALSARQSLLKVGS